MESEIEEVLHKIREMSIQEGIGYDIRGLLYDIEYKVRECLYAIKNRNDDGQSI